MPPPRSTVRVRVHPLGDTAVLAELGTKLDTALNARAIALAAALKKRRDVRQALAGHASVTVQFDPDQITHEAMAAAIRPGSTPCRDRVVGISSAGPRSSCFFPTPTRGRCFGRGTG